MRNILFFFIFISLAGHFALGAPGLRVAFSLNKPPYVLESTSSGLEVELISRVFAEMNTKVTPYYQPPARALRSLENGLVDAMATSAVGGKFFYSDSYITFRNAAWSLKKNNIALSEISDLSKYSVIGFQNSKLILGSQYEQAVSKAPSYRELADQYRQFKMLQSNRTQIIICEERLLQMNKQAYAASEKKTPIEVVRHSLFPESQYSVAFRSLRLRDDFNTALRKLQAAGSFKDLFEKYTPAD